MRLIDADALLKRFKEHYDLFMSAYKNKQDMNLADRSRVDEILNSIAEVINAPTVCDIEQKSCDTCIYNGVFSLECARCDDNCTKWEPKIIDEYIK